MADSNVPEPVEPSSGERKPPVPGHSFSIDHPETLAAAAAVAHGVAHVLAPDEEVTVETEAVAEEKEMTEETHWVQDKIDLFEIIYSGDKDLVYFYTPAGEVLKILKLPKDWNTRPKEAQQKKLKKEKMEIKTKGPVLMDGISLSFAEADGDSLVETASERSLEKYHDPRYFDGEEKSMRDAMWEIAQAYEIPFEIALGFAANQSLVNPKGIDRAANGTVGGKGLFKFTTSAFEEALGYMSHNTEFGKHIRNDKLGEFSEEWQNPFVQSEAFCAYYRRLRLLLNREGGAIAQLENRLQKIDPNFSKDIIEELTVVTAYHSGPTRVSEVVSQFIKQSDEAIKNQIGNPPYWVDIWPKLLMSSFNENGIDQKSIDFTSKVYAMASLMSNEGEDYVEGLTAEQSNWFGSIVSLVSKATGLVALVAGAEGARRAIKKKRSSSGLSRRDLLKGIAAGAAAVSVPGISAAEALIEEIRENADEVETETAPPPSNSEIPVFAEALAPAKKALDAKYKDLRKEKRIYRTNTEKNDVRRYLQPEQDKLLKATFDKVLGKELADKILGSKGQKQSKRNALYDEADKKAKAYRDARIKDGTFVSLNEDNGEIYFCEQVGKESGTSNNPDCLVVHKDLIPLLGSVIELVNHQIDLFNKSPEDYGKKDFPKIPHISAIKICGAFREPAHTKRMLNGRQAGRTTKSLSAHWSGQALDLASLATPGAHVVRFKEAMLDEKGQVAISAGGKLPTGGFGKTTRQILSTFIGRALVTLRDPLIKNGILEIMPIWESGQSNWHVASNPLK